MEIHKERSRHRYRFANALVFQEVMSDADLCRRTAEVLLNIDIQHVGMRGVEERIDLHPDAHGVRLDALLKADGRSVNIEMQTVYSRGLPRRMRFYQSLIDLRELERGQVDYSCLPDSAVVFICMFDPFELGQSRYEVLPAVTNAGNEPIDVGMRWVLLNATAWRTEPDESLRNLLAYAINEFDGASDGIFDDPLIRDIDAAVAAVNANERWVKKNMAGLIECEEIMRMDKAAWRHDMEMGFAEGRAEACTEIAEKLRELGVSSDIIAQACGDRGRRVES